MHGSEWHLLRYLGYHRARLAAAVEAAVGGHGLHWFDLPFDESEQGESEWKGLDFLPCGPVKEEWANWWPQTGNVQNWDAVGLIQCGSVAEWILAEAKGHRNEIASSCGARSEDSREKIGRAFAETQEAMGIAANSERWLASSYYQFCNRLAVLHFLLQHDVPARLVFMYFCGEDVTRGQPCCGDEHEWIATLGKMHEAVGLDSACNYHDRIHEVFLPIRG